MGISNQIHLSQIKDKVISKVNTKLNDENMVVDTSVVETLTVSAGNSVNSVCGNFDSLENDDSDGGGDTAELSDHFGKPCDDKNAGSDDDGDDSECDKDVKKKKRDSFQASKAEAVCPICGKLFKKR
jgi:hypothetical protein